MTRSPVGPEKPLPAAEAATPEARQALVPPPVALLSGGALAALGTQLLLTAPAFQRLYATAGVELPRILHWLMRAPVGLPLSFLLVALLAFATGGIPAPRDPRATRLLRVLVGLVIAVTLADAALVAYGLPMALAEVQQSIQQ
ncbi:MAG: hypothetical protein AB7N76_16480 [Planctomycetota bacterium]